MYVYTCAPSLQAKIRNYEAAKFSESMDIMRYTLRIANDTSEARLAEIKRLEGELESAILKINAMTQQEIQVCIKSVEYNHI